MEKESGHHEEYEHDGGFSIVDEGLGEVVDVVTILAPAVSFQELRVVSNHQQVHLSIHIIRSVMILLTLGTSVTIHLEQVDNREEVE